MYVNLDVECYNDLWLWYIMERVDYSYKRDKSGNVFETLFYIFGGTNVQISIQI